VYGLYVAIAIAATGWIAVIMGGFAMDSPEATWLEGMVAATAVAAVGSGVSLFLPRWVWRYVKKRYQHKERK